MRIRKISIKGLFGRFDHEIPLNLEDRITLVHGPNGFGKTTILRLIAALFGVGDTTLLSLPYGEIQVDFADGHSLRVVRGTQGKARHPEKRATGVRFIYRNRTEESNFTLVDRRTEQLEIPFHAIDELIPELDREGPNLWRNLETGELLGIEEVLDRFGDRLPVARGEKMSEPPEWLKAVRKSVPIRFIQAERLQTTTRRIRTRHTPRASSGRTVKLYSEELNETIRQKLTEYAALSQSLDRTFPTRVVTQGKSLSIQDLQAAMKEIAAKRARLVEAGLLEREGEDTTAQVLKHIGEANLPVLTVYAQDTQQKLGVFDDLAARVELFKRSINDRFLYKQISIGKEGFSFTSAEGDRLDPTSLSSGEQHEIVLLYQLLFRATENSLLLLDEPEISLHVAWQEQFLPDLLAVAKLSSFDALVATHSPLIIGDRWDLTVELKGPVHEAALQSTHVSK